MAFDRSMGSSKSLSMQRIRMLASVVVLGGCAARTPHPDYAAASRSLDQARAEITPPLGATNYTLDRQRLLNQPGGENRSLAGSLAQVPGVSLGQGGQPVVRGR